MKTTYAIILGLCAATAPLHADILNFDLSPAGSTAAVGLSPANEVPAPVAASTGSGNETFTGITFDTATKVLSVSLGYGSFAGFTNLTGPATAAHIHGPAAANATAAPIHDFFTAGQHLFAPISANGGVIVGNATLAPANETALLNGQLYINLHTAANTAGEIRAQLIQSTNSSPTVTCPENAQIECEDHETPVELVAHVADSDGDPLLVVWTIDGVAKPSISVPSGGATTSADVPFTADLDVGPHTVSVSVSDGTAVATSCTATITVVDTVDPVIKSVKATPNSLWPPNHKMKNVNVKVVAEDACGDVTWEIVSVSSNEDENGSGDGNTGPDWNIVDEDTVQLRAERSGNGDGRIYTITVEATDESGNTATDTVEVTVPHSKGKKNR
ncbi:MAG TPA: CHRD domain-containing protein [Haloferula sp.]